MSSPVSSGAPAASTGEAEIEALQDLLGLAVRLRESGAIEIITRILDIIERNRNEINELLGLAEAMLRGLSTGGKQGQLGANAEQLAACLASALSAQGLGAAKPVGLGGILSALRDKDVQKGIGILIELIRSIGNCYNKR